MKIRPIAIYLPQYHPIPENDEWWGKGFTEWTNVAKAKPLFEGHYQPHLPSDLGFYDLRVPEIREAQAKMASEHGIYGFCYYHYWFNGKRLLNRPIDDMLASKTPDFPFMVCWANENWTRTWDGDNNHILLHQEYSLKDDQDHMRFLCSRLFSDNRYIRVDGKPFIVIYRPELFPNIKKTIEIWREEAHKSGIGEIYIGCMHNISLKENVKSFGFDCKIEFEPNFSDLPLRKSIPLKERIFHKLGLKNSPYCNNQLFSYPQYVDFKISKMQPRSDVYPGITPGWDNSPRRSEGATIFTDSTPTEYARWLKEIVEMHKNENTFLFINAWNEWAEGNHLEPCMRWGREYLEATKKVLCNG